ncbi:formyltransferase family protein [Polycyclovorans algicola]|uniref:formyltransferase family protein n=1 Tax=Polycyclovorans algicola TaxID=616992 RepID=UPI0004A74F54|nr:formyltransferase family protein [Polycyclovorans algicola]
MKADYRPLILTSIPGADIEAAAIASRYFKKPAVLFWEMGNAATKPEVLAHIEAMDYNLIISHVSGIILKPAHLQRATYGAVNIHPAPPEHGGCWGCWCQPIIDRTTRTHHGVTVHEIDEQIDHGPIYLVERWEVPETASIQDVFERSVADCQRMLATVCERIADSDVGTRCFTPIDEHWDPNNRHTPIEEIRAWFAGLAPDHPAHQERIFMNHPRAIMAPPYFDDL